MKKIPKTDFKNFISVADANTANRVYPLSIAQGYQTGDIYVNDGHQPSAVFFWHYCGFGYISGKAPENFLADIYSEMISPHACRRLVLITDEEDIVGWFRDKDVLTGDRKEYVYIPGGGGNAAFDRERFRIEPISPGIISEIKGKITPSFSWDSPERFLKRGFGYAALEGEEICAAAFSSAVSSDEIDIGVETREEYRGNGLAAALTMKMCDHIIRIGKRPVWAHAASNLGSMKTAVKSSFVLDRVNTFIKQN